jgi:hypothetical protein
MFSAQLTSNIDTLLYHGLAHLFGVGKILAQQIERGSGAV